MEKVYRPAPPIDVFVASAHLAVFESSSYFISAYPYSVYLNTMLPDTNQTEPERREQMKFKCISDSGEVADSVVVGIDGGQDCSWKNYYFICGFYNPLSTVRLVDDQVFGPEITVKQPIARKIPLVVCLSRTFYYENWQVMLTVLEMYKTMGVSEFSIHILNVVKEVYDILKLYEREINLKINPGFIIPKIDGRLENPNFHTETMNQIMCYNDCLYSYREAAEFMIFSDMDDLIMPENGDLLSKARSLLEAFPMAAGFEFVWATSHFRLAPSLDQFSIPQLFKSLTVKNLEAYGKSIVIPKRMKSAIIHNVAGESTRVFGYENINSTFTVDAGRTVHIRGAETKEQDAADKNSDFLTEEKAILNNKAIKLADSALKSRSRTDKKFEDVSALRSLPPTLFFTPQFRQCYTDITMIRNAGTSLCASMSNCRIDHRNGPKCATANADYAGYINGKLNFYVANNLRIEEDTGCELKIESPAIFEL
ncbi:unnamed protein product [Bursaphelenchus xylophilus]|uniref:Glycosyltransferase family 92 protein n=1 Tax=Bursaphelenchus xylophilus TaxID=6326 RepID=A0A1I7SCU1_BURXY|nr:unnamed protein product [Bursaphelenchus xylophilus]CAG9093484.1 unnamed protein product [Bursaphelenchus xylophilus]